MKKKGSGLIIAIFVLAIVSMLILSSYKEIMYQHKEIRDDIQLSHDDNVRNNGLRLLKYELKKINDYQDQRGMFFKKGSKYLLNTPSYININKVNYNTGSKSDGSPLAEPKSGKYYTGVVINSYYDYIGKTLREPTATNVAVDYKKTLPWFAVNLYFNNSSSKFSNHKQVNFIHLKWINRVEDSPAKTKYTSLFPLISGNNNKQTSIGGYKVQKIKMLTGSKKEYIGIEDFNKDTSGTYSGLVKITYEKQIVLKTQNSNPKKDMFLITMSIQANLVNGEIPVNDLIQNKDIVRTAKIKKIENKE